MEAHTGNSLGPTEPTLTFDHRAGMAGEPCVTHVPYPDPNPIL